MPGSVAITRKREVDYKSLGQTEILNAAADFLVDRVTEDRVVAGGSLVQSFIEKPPFNFLARPGCFAQKCEAGFDAGINLKTANGNSISHLGPAMLCDQSFHYGLKGDAV